MKKQLLYFGFTLTLAYSAAGQQNYCDFEGNQFVAFGPHTGKLDTAFLNPLIDATDTSAHCAKYIRDTASFDFIKMYSHSKLIDVTPYADSNILAPKISMKLLSTAPVGTVVLLQLGIRGVDNYPAGIHSEYIAVTKSQNVWEVDTFNFWQKPAGSLVTSSNVDKIVLLFNPGANTKDSIYFDDITGPALIPPIGISEINNAQAFKLYQNFPNPVKEKTTINFHLNSEGSVELKLYDIVGNQVAAITEQKMKAGTYSFPVDTKNISSGVYFYALTVNEISQVRKMIVSK